MNFYANSLLGITRKLFRRRILTKMFYESSALTVRWVRGKSEQIVIKLLMFIQWDGMAFTPAHNQDR
jgi:hypothetical protein